MSTAASKHVDTTAVDKHSLDTKRLSWLVSLPHCMHEAVERGDCSMPAGVASGADPEGCPLGAGGGTIHLLQKAAASDGMPLPDWMQGRCSVVLHGGGQSRRLPAYATVGKPFIPVPVFRWSAGQHLDQTLFDLQRDFVENLLGGSAPGVQLAITSGDVLLQGPSSMPALPDADIVMVGMHARPEDACHFGVLFCDKQDPASLRFFLQKPSADTIRKHSDQTSYFVDCGLWLLREKAVKALLKATQWNAETGEVQPFDLYGAWGPCFGHDPVQSNPAVQGLSVAVAPLEGGVFHHFGRTSDVIDAVYELQNPAKVSAQMQSHMHAPHPRQFVQNATFSHPLGLDQQACIWVENACVPETWEIRDHHMITNIPENDWHVNLPSGICLDMPPVMEGGRAIRLYGINDVFRGQIDDPSTTWLGGSFTDWCNKRGLSLESLGIPPGTDIQDAPLFPVLKETEQIAEMVDWIVTSDVEQSSHMEKERWLEATRVSASDLLSRTDVAALQAERAKRLRMILPVLANQHARNMFFRLDLLHFSRLFGDAGFGAQDLPAISSDVAPLQRMHGYMLASQVSADCGDAVGATASENSAFRTLRDEVLQPIYEDKTNPTCQLLEDQIVWGRSPARLDLAGGWSDTPPYCLENGGRVINLAVNLNGQPPIQVFGRLLSEPKLVIRSIDLGISDELTTYDDVDRYQQLGSGFAIARAAFALAGFSPDFCSVSYRSLEEQLKAFGGGIELSMLAAIPKGSGLGTSSILAATILGVLGNLAGLPWERAEIARRTLALEQMLTSGGGWQDQIGGVYGGVKLIETHPGLSQEPVLRWAPESFFGLPHMQSCMMLYYTGITRVAHNILGEIVRGLFLNSRDHLRVIDQISRHAQQFYELLLQQDVDSFAAGLKRSWELNQRLDAGTNVPAIAKLIAGCGDALAGCKLAGAGGGGFLLMQARDPDAANWIRTHLTENPPNSRARFVDWSISTEGLQVTRS